MSVLSIDDNASSQINMFKLIFCHTAYISLYFYFKGRCCVKRLNNINEPDDIWRLQMTYAY